MQLVAAPNDCYGYEYENMSLYCEHVKLRATSERARKTKGGDKHSLFRRKKNHTNSKLLLLYPHLTITSDLR